MFFTAARSRHSVSPRHEAGHAIQHAQAYGPLKFRSFIVKPATIDSKLGMVAAVLGFAVQSSGLVWPGIVLFSTFVLFTLVTLPVEFDASKRAVIALQQIGIISPREAPAAAAVLRAAAMTYLAAAVSAMLQWLYFVLRASALSDTPYDMRLLAARRVSVHECNER
jgi:hypothetical protein